MFYPSRSASRATRRALKVLNISLILALLVGLLPTATLLAAEPQRALGTPGGNCTVPTSQNNRVFLPAISSAVNNGLNNVLASTQSSPTQTVRKLDYEVGKTYVYDYSVTIKTKSASRDSEGTNDNGEQTTVIHALADVAVTGVESDGTYLGQVTLRDSFICSTNGEGDESISDNQELKDALAVPMTFKQSPNGVVRAIAHPANAPVNAVNMQKGVINALQLTLREGQDTYTAEENGAQGAYTVQYTLAEQNDGLHITKSYNQDSFSSLISQGQRASSFTLTNQIQALLSNTKGVIESVQVTEGMQSSDESQNPIDTNDDPTQPANADIDGVAAWSAVTSQGALKLTEVKDSGVLAAAAWESYQSGGLAAELVEVTPNRLGIDLENVDLAAEFAALEADPANPALIDRMIALVDADDERNMVLDALAERMTQNATNDAIVAAYLDVLTGVGSPAAQAIISSVLESQDVQAASLAAVLSDAAREHALLNLVLIDSPTMTTVNTLQSLSSAADSGLQSQAIAVLGAAADNIADEDAATAATIAADLTQGLQNATTLDELELYLDALGNAGQPESLSVIDDYISGTVTISGTVGTTETLNIRMAALTALRKIPGDDAESLLLGSLSNTGEDDGVRDLVAAVLSGRDLSEDGTAALSEYQEIQNLAPPGLYVKSWNKHLGGSTVGVNLPGHIVVASPPRTSGLYLYARQAADAHIWSFRPNLITGQVLSYRVSTGQKFGAYLSIANNLVRRQYEIIVGCIYDSGTRSLYNGSLTFFSATVRIPIFWALSINLSVRAQGYFSLTFRYNHNLCSPTNLVGTTVLTPSVWASATASAYVSIEIARGGATLYADLLRTSMPGSLQAAYNGSSLRFCTDIKVNTQALSGRLDIWGDLRVFRWGIPPWKWKRIVTATVWTFGTPSRSYTLLDRCW